LTGFDGVDTLEHERQKGTKHSSKDKQAWWCEAPPRTKPLFDHQARILAAEKQYAEMNAALAREME
jgi:hypothetical protein